MTASSGSRGPCRRADVLSRLELSAEAVYSPVMSSLRAYGDHQNAPTLEILRSRVRKNRGRRARRAIRNLNAPAHDPIGPPRWRRASNARQGLPPNRRCSKRGGGGGFSLGGIDSAVMTKRSQVIALQHDRLAGVAIHHPRASNAAV